MTADKATDKPRIRVPAGSVPSVRQRVGDHAAFMRGEASPVFQNWRPALRNIEDDVRVSWTDAASRAIDMIQNSGFIAGIVDQSTASVVGNGLRLSSKPDAQALGITADEAGDIGRQIERRWEHWSGSGKECDAAGRQRFGQQQAAAYKQWMAYGEILAALPWRRHRGRMYGTKVRLIPPSRLSDRTMAPDIMQGVRLDGFGGAVSYFLKPPRLIGQESEVPASDDMGRPTLVHIFDGAPGQVRGMTPFAPILKVAKQFDQLADATLTAAIIQAVFAASIKSNEPTEDVMRMLQTPGEQAAGEAAPIDAWMEAREGWYQNTRIDLGIPGRFVHLFPGQELAFHDSKHPNGNYKEFANYLVREIARCAGLTFESATGDYSGATYSSVRMGTADIFAVTLMRRQNLVALFCQYSYEAWLEEELFSGRIEAPGGPEAFIENRSALARAEWRGTARPQADDVKAATAHKIWRDMGVITDEAICADLGQDVEDVYEQRAREAKMRAQYGLADNPGGNAAAVTVPSDEVAP